jgi:Protein of unknown function (DUF3300)
MEGRNSRENIVVRLARVLASGLILNATFPFDALAQATPPPTAVAQPANSQSFNAEQLDALLAPIALYPDDLLTQVLMASTFPLEVVAAARWVEEPAHKSLSGDTLAKALEAESWDASVKSLAPFPVVLATMNGNLPWLQQLGYAFAGQQADVFASVQRLRRQAQANDKLQSSPQQVVSTEVVTTEPPPDSNQAQTQQEVIVIEPAQPDVIYVPTYDPRTVYGTWPYPAYPPYYAPPPSGYYFGTALATGMAFAAGAAIVGGIWGWASPAWGGGYANVNVNRYNNINVNRAQVASSRWGANYSGGRPANFSRAPGGPVGLPGRSQVSVPGNAVRPPTRPGGIGGAGRPSGPGGVGGIGGPGGPGGVGGVGGPGRPGGVGGAGGPGRPGGPGGVGGVGGVGRPGGPGGVGGATRPSGASTTAAQRPAGGAQRPAGGAQRPAGGAQRVTGPQRGAFGDVNSGRQAGQFGQRGAQSRSAAQQRSFAGGSRGGGAARGARGGRR